MSEKLGVGDLNSAIPIAGSGELTEGEVGGMVKASESKTLGMNSGVCNTLGLGGGVRGLDGLSINGKERNFFESGNLEMDIGRGRVAELKPRNHRWESSLGVMDLVGRVLDGKLRMDNETEGVNVFESGPEVNLVANIEDCQVIVGEPISEHGSGIVEPIIDKDSGYLNLNCRVEGNGLNGHPQDSILPNEMVPDGTTETEEEKMDALIPRERGECVTEIEGEYYLSDLVWGKVRSHPWWPGQIFDPSTASDKAKNLCKRNRYLTAYFGDETFAWNQASQIKPFRMHFSKMEKQNGTEGFFRAVECALDEVAQRVELGLSCTCLPPKVDATAKVHEEASAGIQEESTRRAGRDNIYGAISFSTGELMHFLESLALSPKCKSERLQLTITKSQLLAFNRRKGFDHLPIYEECPRFLEDLSKSTLKGEAKESLQGPGSESANNFPSKRRKMTVRSRSTSPPRKRKMTVRGSSLSKKRETTIRGSSLSKRRKTTVRGSYSQKHKHLSGDVGTLKIKQKRLSELMSSTVSSFQKDEKSTKGETIPSQIPHPDAILSELIFAAKHPKEVKISTLAFLCEIRKTIWFGKSIPGGTAEEDGEHMTADLSKDEGAEDSYWTDRIIQLHSESQAFQAPDNASKRAAELDLVLNSDVKREREVVVPYNASKGASELDAAAVSVSNSTYRKERQIVACDNASKRAAELDVTTVSPNSGSSKKKEIVFVDLDAEEDSSIPKNNAPDEEQFPTALILNFTSLDSIPSIRNLNAIFRRFGPIKETETEILTKSKRAKVIFQNREHAEAAFSSTGKFSIFGPSLISYRLNYAPTIKKYRATAKRGKKAVAGNSDA